MITAWTKHIKDPEDKAKFQQGLINSRWVLDRQTEVLQELWEGLEREEISPRAYDKPNWEHRQAHCNGFKQCLQVIKNLNNLDPRTETPS